MFCSLFTLQRIQMDNQVLKQATASVKSPIIYVNVCIYLCRILSSLLLSCELSIPGRAAATRRKS